jgi:hypothetical protein
MDFESSGLGGHDGTLRAFEDHARRVASVKAGELGWLGVEACKLGWNGAEPDSEVI